MLLISESMDFSFKKIWSLDTEAIISGKYYFTYVAKETQECIKLRTVRNRGGSKWLKNPLFLELKSYEWLEILSWGMQFRISKADLKLHNFLNLMSIWHIEN